MKRVRVLIVEDSATSQLFLRSIIGSDPRLEICGQAASGEEAISQVLSLKPDVISMDVRLPGMDGLETTRKIMGLHPTPIVIVSSSLSTKAVDLSFSALRAGALVALPLPEGSLDDEISPTAREMCEQLYHMSQVRVVRQRPMAPVPHRVEEGELRELRLLGLVASTGGPPALVKLLNDLGPDFPLAILLVQHITAAFTEGFCRWLGGVCPQSVQLVQGGELPLPGHVYLAKADHHLVVGRTTLGLDTGQPVQNQCPSGSVLFSSMARYRATESVGVVLTGMGEDGAAGLLELREAGGYTIAEDESSAVIFGMPKAAIQIGASREALPLGSIARRLWALTQARLREVQRG
jgi:two-component system chemotaxis response regulator CheB